MRFLNKITFINSAHIRYAEVAIDGNVHFTGTQGVGKTTLLRALLFFYNCRKDKLGIRAQGQQAFDDFYVPNSSSYIIYEVTRGPDEPPFSIILFRHHNRAAFRFVDAPYSKDWFIDDLGLVASDQFIVRQRIQSCGIDYSGIIDRYTHYLDILYGNRSAHLSKDLLKYYLLRSQQYHNIPRIIQNVFLNERVDAGFIKNIIINSITEEDEEIAVDLNFFRSKLIHFSEELRDISLWTEKNRNGIVETRMAANKIIAISHEIKATEFSLHEHCGMLNYAISKAKRDIPSLQSRISKKESEKKEITETIEAQRAAFDKERRKIDSRIAVLDSRLKEASSKKKEYQRIGIEEMISRATKLDGLKLQRGQKERVLAQLTSNHQSISDKYSMLRDRINLDKEQFLQTLREKRNSIISDFYTRGAERLKRKSILESEIRDRFKTQIAEIEDKLNSLREFLNDRKEQRAKTSVSSPRKDDLESCQRKITEAENKARQSTEAKLKQENLLETLQNTLELKCQQIEIEAEMQIKDIENRIHLLELQRQDELQLLDKTQGSLCEWLDNNITGWEKTIGKIADEKAVLYSQNLNPNFSENNNDTVYGIHIDLDSIEKDVRTPSMIQESANSLEKEIRSQTDLIIQLRGEMQNRIAEDGKDIRNRIKSVKSEIDSLTLRIRINQNQSKEESLRMCDIKEEEKKYLDEILTSFDNEIFNLQFQIDNLSKERRDINSRCDAELRVINKTISNEEKNDAKQKEALLEAIDKEAEDYSKKHGSQLNQLDIDENTELSESGANISMLDTTKKEINAISSVIARIEEERDKIVEYRKDCRDLLDHVPQMQAERKKLQDEEDGLCQKYENRRQRLDHKRQEIEKDLASLCASYRQAFESKQEADNFTASKACPSDLMKISPIQTEQDCVAIISCLQRLMVDIHQQSNALKEDTNEFRKRFSPNNTFKFPTVFDTIEDYHRYAGSIEDFVSNDKIKEFQQVTSNLYRDILSRAASDFNLLLGRESEIIRLVKAINHDFEKKTFAGVIRSIELRLERSTMPIITQLQNITDFWNEHQYELGDINLFSTDEHIDINKESIKYLKSLANALQTASGITKLPLEQTFALKFRIQENDYMTDWVENIRAIGSEGTDILVKAIINILLISVFKSRAGERGEFRLHCMMDEIGRLADENIQGILNFANQRGIFVVNSSPKAHRPLSYRRLYMLSKDNGANTTVQPILSTREAELL